MTVCIIRLFPEKELNLLRQLYPPISDRLKLEPIGVDILQGGWELSKDAQGIRLL